MSDIQTRPNGARFEREAEAESCSLLCSTSGGSHPDSDTGSFLLLRRHCTETKHAVHKRRNRKSTTFSCVVGGQRASENGAEYLSLFPFLLLLCVNVTSLSVCFGTLCGDSGSGTGELLWKTLGFSATVNLTRCENKWTWIERIDLHSYSVSLSGLIRVYCLAESFPIFRYLSSPHLAVFLTDVSFLFKTRGTVVRVLLLQKSNSLFHSTGSTWGWGSSCNYWLFSLSIHLLNIFTISWWIVKTAHHNFSRAQGDIFKSLLLSGQQSKKPKTLREQSQSTKKNCKS